MEALFDFLSLADPNVRFVVLGMVLLGASSSIVGTFTFLRKRALLGDAIAHSVLPGVCLAFLMAGNKNPLWLLLGAVVTGWLSLIVIDIITSKTRIKPDAAIGLTLSVFFGVGILLLTAIQQTGNAAQSGLDKFLFGKAASLLQQDIIIFVVLSIFLILAVVVAFKEFALIAFDEDFAKATGFPVRRLELVLATLTVFSVAIGIQAVGVVLMSALLVTPAAAARYWTNNLPKMVALAAFFGGLAGVLGAAVSYSAPAMPTGPWVIVMLSLMAFFSMFFAPQRGILSRKLFQRNTNQKVVDENLLKTFYLIAEKGDKKFFAARSQKELMEGRHFGSADMKRSLKRLVNASSIMLDKSTSTETWELTESGRNKAQRLVRIHRLWEVYLTRYLKVAPDHVHDDAEAIEHLITPELEAELEQLLDFPDRDPHNSEIPKRVDI